MNECVKLGIFIAVGAFFLGMLVSFMVQKEK